MTDRHAGYIITLAADVDLSERAHDRSRVVLAKGVLTVEPVIADAAFHIGESRVRHEMAMRLFEFAREVARDA